MSKNPNGSNYSRFKPACRGPPCYCNPVSIYNISACNWSLQGTKLYILKNVIYINKKKFKWLHESIVGVIMGLMIAFIIKYVRDPPPPPLFFWNLIEFFRCFLRISKNLMRKSFLTWFYRQSFFQADIIWEKLTFLIIFGISVSLESRGQSFILWLSPFFLVIKKSKAFAFFFFPFIFLFFNWNSNCEFSSLNTW